MGTSKQTLDLEGKPMLEHVLDVFSGSAVDETILVLSPTLGWKPNRRENLRVVYNKDAEKGISTSVKVGIECVDRRSEAAVIGLADKPLVRTSSIDSLIDAHRRSPAEIIVPVYKGKRGNPILFRRELFQELRRLEGDIGAKPLIEGGKYRIEEVPVDDVGVLFDIDTPEDMKRAKELLSVR